MVTTEMESVTTSQITQAGSSLSTRLERDIGDALTYLRDTLQCCYSTCGSHNTVIVAGLADDERVREAIARYLVGIRAAAVDAALNIKANLEDTQEDREEVFRSVIQIVKQEIDPMGDPLPDWVTRERNPWLAEGIWHLLMAVAAHRSDIHPPGLILLLSYAHIKAIDHGMDVSAVFHNSGSIGFSIVETKAYRDDLNSAISSATEFFREVKLGTHDSRIRQAVQIMRTALPASEQGLVSDSFWKRNRVYIYNPHYGRGVSSVDWTNRRPSLAELASERERILIMPNELVDFDQYFNDIADRMRGYAQELQQCTMHTHEP